MGGMDNDTSARPRLTPKGERTRARIVEKAAALIHERGVAGTFLEDVKAAAEVSGSQLYHYFPDKDDLVQAVIDYQADAIVDRHRQALDNTNGVLRHAWSANGTFWNFENLDGGSGSVSGYTASVGSDPTAVSYSGTLQVFYYDSSYGNLRHAWSNSIGWHFENLDGDPGSIGKDDADVGYNPAALVSGWPAAASVR